MRTGSISNVFVLVPGDCFKSYLPLSIINYGISKHYAGFQVCDSFPLGYLFFFFFAICMVFDFYNAMVQALFRELHQGQFDLDLHYLCMSFVQEIIFTFFNILFCEVLIFAYFQKD